MRPAVAAVVVAFHPDRDRLASIVASLSDCQRIYIVDNTPDGAEPITHHAVEWVPLHGNAGVARAHNVGISRALAAGHTHVLLFDQDSSPPPGIASKLLRVEGALLAEGKRVAAVVPAFRDVKSGVVITGVSWTWHGASKRPLSYPATETDALISSGSLIRAEVLRAVGGMIDDLFIDWVDIEWSLRAKSMGYRSYIAAYVMMGHSIGDRSRRVLGRPINIHNDNRKFYIIRNAVALARLPYIPRRARIGILAKALCKYVPAYLILSPNRRAVAATIFRAVVEGLRMRGLAPTQMQR